MTRQNATPRNERDANDQIAASVPRCQPCTWKCNQGRGCPARIRVPESDEGDSLGVWIGLRNAICITAALAALVLGGWELLWRAAS